LGFGALTQQVFPRSWVNDCGASLLILLLAGCGGVTAGAALINPPDIAGRAGDFATSHATNIAGVFVGKRN
jgi:hypothetical protein